MKLGEIFCKGIMSRSGIGGVDYSINPYFGCSHGCVYCYARFMTRFSHQGEEWGSFVDAKINAVEVLKAEAPRRSRGKVLLSSVTDPYQPLEEKYCLTRRCLEVLLEYGYSVDILTKNILALRDLSLFDKFSNLEVGFTITSLDDRVRLAFEPGGSSVKERLEALKIISDKGIPTYAFLGPILPYLSEDGLVELLDILADRVERLIVDRLNIKCGNLPLIRRVLSEYYPDIQLLFERALLLNSNYYRDFRANMIKLCRERSIPVDIVY